MCHLPRAGAGTGSATVAPAELDAASTRWFDVLCTGMLVPTAPIDKVARYESRVADNHHHVGAGRAVSSPISFAVGTNPCSTASDDHGFAIDEAEVMCWGSVPRPLHRTKFLNPPP